jgi:hypothetical protein
MPLNFTNTRISKLLRLALLTDKDGEALTALKHLRLALEAAQLDIHDFVDYASTFEAPKKKFKPTPTATVDWIAQVQFLAMHPQDLSSLEKKFVLDYLVKCRRPLSEKQKAWLDAIYNRVKFRGAKV